MPYLIIGVFLGLVIISHPNQPNQANLSFNFERSIIDKTPEPRHNQPLLLPAKNKPTQERRSNQYHED